MMDISKAKLPNNLPQCACFQTNLGYTWGRCNDVAKINNTMCAAFDQLVTHEQFCPSSLVFILENTILTLLAYVAKSSNRELMYGSAEIEQETERLLKGLEERVLTASRYSYEQARTYGLTEENVKAERESVGKTRQ